MSIQIAKGWQHNDPSAAGCCYLLVEVAKSLATADQERYTAAAFRELAYYLLIIFG